MKLPCSNPTKTRILIAEDDTNLRDGLAVSFQDLGYDVLEASSLSEVRSLPIKELPYALIDLKLGKDNGLDVLRHVIQESPACEAIVLTGYGSIATAIRAVRLGATDYLPKPVSVAHIHQVLVGGNDEFRSDFKAASLARQEREYIEFVVDQCDGNITQAARSLGIHRQSLQRKLRKFSPIR